MFFTKVMAPGIGYTTLVDVPMAVVCHPRLIKEVTGISREAAKATTLLKKIDIISSSRAQYQRHPTEEFLKTYGVRAEFSLEANSQEAQKRLCLAGGGIANLARFMVEPEINTGELAEVPTRKPVSVELSLAMLKGRELSRGASEFLKLAFPAHR